MKLNIASAHKQNTEPKKNKMYASCSYKQHKVIFGSESKDLVILRVHEIIYSDNVYLSI